MKKAIIGILVLCLLVCFQTVFADGTCGTNVKYTIDGETINFSKLDHNHDADWKTDCGEVFKEDSGITQVIIVDPIRVLDASSLFSDFEYVEEMNLSNLDVSNVTDMSHLFEHCVSLKILDVSGWDTSNVTDMSWMFYFCSFLKDVDVSDLDTTNVTDMSYMFYACNQLTNLNLGSWDTSNVTHMSCMFTYCRSLTNLDVSEWDISNVTTLSTMFLGCSSLKSVDVSKWDTSSVTSLLNMFLDCSSLTSVDVSEWDISNVTALGGMFRGCSSLKSVDVSEWDTSSVIYMGGIFYGCSLLESIDVSKWNTSNVSDMNFVFEDCTSLASVDLGGWDTSNVTMMASIFSNCDSLKTLVLGRNTLKENIFESLPNYKSTWYYTKPSAEAGSPLALNTAKKNGALFTGYKYNTMAGSWSTVPVMSSMSIITPSGKVANGRTLTGYVGRSYIYTITPTPSNASNAVTWKSALTSVATITTAGKATCKAAGTAKITATAKDGSGVTANFNLKCVVPKMSSMSIITPSGKVANGRTLTGYVGRSYIYTITPKPAAASNAVIWKSAKTSVATITTAGKATCKAAGTAKITATAKDGSGVTANFNLKCVVPKMSSMSIITPSGRTANGKTLIGTVGRSYTYTITPKPAAASNAVTWKSSKTSVATITTTGKATCKAAGTAKITATAKDGSGITANFAIKCVKK